MPNWWHNLPEYINPNIIEIGSFHIRYYGLMYIIAFAVVYLLVLFRLNNEKFEYSREIIQRFLAWCFLGVVLGGRLGHVLYEFRYYAANPFEIFLPFDFSNGLHFTGYSGMSFHGGLIGVILVTIVFCYRNKINIWRFADLFSPAVPLGYTFGRLGNFINGELYGRITNVPWGMYFPLDPARQLRHPSQLYEAFGEGIILFIILWSLRKVKYFDGFLFSLYLIGYGAFRFFIEFARQPDRFALGPFTMGQIFCAGMALTGMPIVLVKAVNNIKEKMQYG